MEDLSRLFLMKTGVEKFDEIAFAGVSKYVSFQVDVVDAKLSSSPFVNKLHSFHNPIKIPSFSFMLRPLKHIFISSKAA